MRRKQKKAALISIATAGALAIILLLAGTMLRMHTHDMRFIEAFYAFSADTFRGR